MELAEGMGCCLSLSLFLSLSAEVVALRKLLKYRNCIRLACPDSLQQAQGELLS